MHIASPSIQKAVAYQDVLTTADDPDIEGGTTFKAMRIAVGDCVLAYTGGALHAWINGPDVMGRLNALGAECFQGPKGCVNDVCNGGCSAVQGARHVVTTWVHSRHPRLQGFSPRTTRYLQC